MTGPGQSTVVPRVHGQLSIVYRRQPWLEVDDLVAATCPADVHLTVLERDASPAEYAEALAGADVLMGSWVGVPWPFDLVGLSATRLRLIQVMSAGYDGPDMDVPRSAGVPVAGVGEVFGLPVAEHTLMLILALLRNLLPAVEHARMGKWRPPPPVRTGDGSVLGIVGMGHIGQRTAEMAGPFGFTVRYFSPHRMDPAKEERLNVSYLPFDELLETSDVVSLSVPLNTKTENMISTRELALMKSSALLVNVSRGGVVDEAALIAALQSGRISGAGLDVVKPEPPSVDNVLLHMPNVIVTPHQAGSSPNVWSRVVETCWKNVDNIVSGSDLRNRIC